MKKIITVLLILIPAVAFGQLKIDSLTVPAAGNDTMVCVPGFIASPIFIDFSDLDGDVYFSMGPSPGDNGFTWATLGSADSLLLDYSADYKVHDGTTYYRKSFEVDFTWDMTCFRIWNPAAGGASADSTLYIYKYKYIP